MFATPVKSRPPQEEGTQQQLGDVSPLFSPFPPDIALGVTLDITPSKHAALMDLTPYRLHKYPSTTPRGRNPPGGTEAQYRAALQELQPYTLTQRGAREADPAYPRLLQQPATLAGRARVLRYVFDGARKNHVLHALLEQANKASDIDRLDKAPLEQHLTQGDKLRSAARHVSNYVVMLPVHPPPGSSVLEPSTLTDTALCCLLAKSMVGHLVVLEYTTGTDHLDNVLFAIGVVADRAYVNAVDLDERLRVYEDDPLTGTPDMQPLLLPVHVLGCVAATPLGPLTWRTAFVVAGGGCGDGGDAVRFMNEITEAGVQLRLPTEMTAFLPPAGTWAAHQDAELCTHRWQAVETLALHTGGEAARVVAHMAHAPGHALQMAPTARARASRASLPAVLGAAITRARQRRFRN